MTFKTSIITCVILIVIGLFLILFPTFSRGFFSILAGIGILGIGISSFVYWSELHKTGGGGMFLVFGICACILAIICLIRPVAFANAIIEITAICVIALGVFNLFMALGTPELDIMVRRVETVAAIIVIIFGILAIIFPVLVVDFIGISLIVEGISQAIMSFKIKRNIIDA